MKSYIDAPNVNLCPSSLALDPAHAARVPAALHDADTETIAVDTERLPSVAAAPLRKTQDPQKAGDRQRPSAPARQGMRRPRRHGGATRSTSDPQPPTTSADP